MKNLFLRVAMTLAFVAMGFTAYAQSTVKGTVKDAAGEAIIGAAVQVAGTHNGAITDIDGSFTLPGVHQGDKLEASCIGYAGQTITWNGGVVNFVLEEDAEMLEGTVVTALGIRKDEKKVGYAVSSVSAESLNATVAPSLGSALYGKASGVRVSTAFRFVVFPPSLVPTSPSSSWTAFRSATEMPTTVTTGVFSESSPMVCPISTLKISRT